MTAAGPSPLDRVLAARGWRTDALAGSPEAARPWEMDAALRAALELAGVRDPDLTAWRRTMYLEARRLLFPQRVPEPTAQASAVASYFFPLARAVVEAQRLGEGGSIAARLPFEPLAPAEVAAWPSAGEYRRLLAHVSDDAVLVSLLAAQQWFGFSIADHVLGVTGLALWIGRQLAASVPLDLPLLHGAAIGHDIGKFGCIGDEERRIPRLHYYYTHVWYQARGLPGLGHIATNHSTWDLERVRLPVETQILIYADFRVKDAPGPDGRPRMSIISLRDAFATIRDKLENLDRVKLARYRSVYSKLRDLEDYLIHLDVELDPPGFDTGSQARPALPRGLRIVDVMSGRQRPDVVSLAVGPAITTTSRLFAAAHNIGVMERLRDVPALRALLEEARTFEGWRDLRTYIGILGEYSPALSMEQRELALDFFFDLLDHRDDDVRYHAANRIGDILALGEEAWRKDLPDGIVTENGNWVLRQLERVLALLDRSGRDPEEDMSATEKVVYSVPLILRRFVRNAGADLRDAGLDFIFASLSARVHDRRPLVGLYVCESFEVLMPFLRPEHKLALPEIGLAWADQESTSTRLMAWRLLVAVAREAAQAPQLLLAVRSSAGALAGRMSREMLVAELHLLEELARLGGLAGVPEACAALRERDRFPLREVLLRNLKARVGWVEKKVNCDYLLAIALDRHKRGDDPESHFATEVAVHLANVLKVSRVEGTRFHAGRCLVEIHGILTVPQKNDLMVELMRSLQLDVEAITRYIPRFLGAIIASLPEQEFQEALDDIELHARRGTEPLQRLLLQTAGWVILNLGEERLADGALRRLAGVMLGSLAETRAATVHEGFAQIAVVLDRLTRKKKSPVPLTMLLRTITKSFLSLVTHKPGDVGRFFLVASALNRLDLAIDHVGRRLRFPKNPSVAFVPGTFDPFTTAHADIVDRALEHADEVLVQIDDYSWRKHAQPRQVRKELAWMALAPIPEAFEAPFEPPFNLANRDSVRQLRRWLGDRDLWVVVGTDVLEGASAYRDADGPIWDVPHLVVRRETHASETWKERLPGFRERFEVVGVPTRARSISSTSLREALDAAGDIDPMCDPLVARTLQERRLYLNYPDRKQVVRPPRHAVEFTRTWDGRADELASELSIRSLPPAARWSGRRHEVCVLTSRETRRPVAGLSWREVTAAALPVELADADLAILPERGLAGPGALVDAYRRSRGDGDEPPWRTLLSRAMARWLDAGLLFALTALPDDEERPLVQAFLEAGASWISGEADGAGERMRWASLRLVDPLVMVWDLEQVLQPPYAAADAVVRAIADGRQELAGYFRERAPGTAMLHLYERETKRVVVEWAQERIAASAGSRRWVVLGLGGQFYRDLIGSSPTLAIDLERYLTWQGYESGMDPAVGSPSLELQLHTAREVGRDALLLVPFLESEEPVLKVKAAAKAAGIAVREVLVGITSASVHATLHLRGIPHQCGAVVPRWQGVIRESALLPFLGGWSIAGREPLETGSLRQSLNDCLPYHHPHPLGLDSAAALDFSRLALNHARRLLRRLEEIFREREGRLLSLLDLAAVVRTPRCPPFPRGFRPPRDRVPSELLEDDLEALARLHPERHHAHRTRWRDA